jgi:cytoskeletal protein RodZ
MTDQLRQQRESQGLSLADVAHETRIPVDRLRLLEEGKIAAIGSMAYARSYLRIYGKFLGVDTSSLAESLPAPVLGGEADYRYLTEKLGSWVDESAPRSVRRVPASRRPRPASKPMMSPVAKAVALLFLIGLVTVVWIVNMPARTSEPAVATSRAGEITPVAMAINTTTNAAPALANNVIPWQDLNQGAVRKAQVVEEDEAEAKKAPPAPEVRRAIAVQ